eukprot:5856268-Prymnesium_polylepis.1
MRERGDGAREACDGASIPNANANVQHERSADRQEQQDREGRDGVRKACTRQSDAVRWRREHKVRCAGRARRGSGRLGARLVRGRCEAGARPVRGRCEA